MDEGVKNNVKRPGGQSLMRSWDCSQIGHTEKVESWRERDQMAAQWDEEQKLEENLERRRKEGSPVHFEFMQNVPQLFVHERMSHRIGVKRIKEKKKVSGWSMEEMKEELSVVEKEDAEEVKKVERSEPE